MSGVDYLAAVCKTLLDKRHLDLAEENACLRETLEETRLQLFWSQYSAERTFLAFGRVYVKRRNEGTLSDDERTRRGFHHKLIKEHGFTIRYLESGILLGDDDKGRRPWTPERRKRAEGFVCNGEHFVTCFDNGWSKLFDIKLSCDAYFPLGILVWAKSVNDPDLVRFKQMIDQLELEDYRENLNPFDVYRDGNDDGSLEWMRLSQDGKSTESV
jgi:hypothetical protein